MGCCLGDNTASPRGAPLYGEVTMKRVCQYCGREFNVKPSRVAKGYGQFCSWECYASHRWGRPIKKLSHKICPICHTTFKPKRQGQVYCSVQCAHRAHYHRVTVQCDWCGRTFERVVSQVSKYTHHFCSVECKRAYWAQHHVPRGEAHPRWNGGPIIKACAYCGRLFHTYPSVDAKFCSRRCMALARQGPGAPNWRGGVSFEPYPPEFNSALKRRIRERDGYRCQLCGITEAELGQRLHIHHIDYDKTNCNPSNLISLCPRCHSLTTHTSDARRESWIEFFRRRLRQSGH